MKRILVTGFEDFDPYGDIQNAPHNSTQDIATALNGVIFTNNGEQVEIIGKVLPVSWETTWVQLQAAIEGIKNTYGAYPDAIVNFGMWQDCNHIELERQAINKNNNIPAPQGVRPPTPTSYIVKGNPDPKPSAPFPTKLNIGYLYNQIQEERGEVQIFTDPTKQAKYPASQMLLPEVHTIKANNYGDCYICNNTFYKVMYYYPQVPVRGFIHVTDGNRPSNNHQPDKHKLSKVVQTGAFAIKKIAEQITSRADFQSEQLATSFKIANLTLPKILVN